MALGWLYHGRDFDTDQTLQSYTRGIYSCYEKILLEVSMTLVFIEKKTRTGYVAIRECSVAGICVKVWNTFSRILHAFIVWPRGDI